VKPDDEIFAEALDLPVAGRAAYLDRACAGDSAQRDRIAALLSAHDSARDYLEHPVVERASPLASPQPGTVIGPYTLRRRLGEGGCGVVWLAEQIVPLRRFVALKVIKPGMDTRSVIARFESERQTLALMNHPDIARVYDAGTTSAGRPYFVMEYVEGVPITRFCDEHNLTMPARLELFARVCIALQHAHQKGVIHRDLKPSNILVTLRDGEPAPKVIDFGIAKATAGGLSGETLHTELGLFLGTPAYMSPEQAEERDDDIDTRSDVYALGVLLYELLTGRPPYDPKELVRAGVLEIRRIIREVDPPRPSTRLATLAEADRDTVARQRGVLPPRLTAALRGDLDWIVMRCLEKERDRRYGTAAALADDVRRHLRSEPVEARPPQLAYRIRKFVARNRLVVASAAVVLLTLVAGTVISTWQAVRATRAERVAATERDTARAAESAEALARADAQRRQEQAEALLTFMLGDFRAELQKIGRLEPLDRVGEQAMSYFTALDPRDLTDTALTRQAKALTQIGEVRLEQARFAEAEAAFTAAYDRAAALASRHPDNGDMLYERAQAEFWIGFVARRRGDFARQREWLVRYRDSAVELSRVEGATERAAMEVVYGHNNLAVLDVDIGNLMEAQAGFIAARAALEPMIAASPNNTDLRLAFTETASWLGVVAESDGRYEDALKYYAERSDGYEMLIRQEPNTARWKFERAQSLTFSGRIARVTGRAESAMDAFNQAGTLYDGLVTSDPANKRWLAARFTQRLFLIATSLNMTGDEKRESDLTEVRREIENLSATEPTSAVFSGLLLSSWRLEARLQFQQSRWDGALNATMQAKKISTLLLHEGRADIWTKHEAAHSLILVGRLAQAASRPADAAEAWQEALNTLGPDYDRSRDWRLLEPAAVALTLLGRHEPAGRLVQQLKIFGYVPPDPLDAATLGLTGSTETSTRNTQ